MASGMTYQLDVISLFPEMFAALLDYGVIGRAVKQKRIQFRGWNPRDFTADRQRSVDDRPYGGGPGMVMLYAPMRAAIDKAKQMQPDSAVIYLSPQGRRLDQAGVRELADRNGMILVAGRYEGIDQRLIESVIDEEWSIGDYVLSGGELAAMVLIDCVGRGLPGVLGHEDSASEDSFVDGLLDYPHYTRPRQIAGRAVPPVLLGGNHEQIRRWRLRQALVKTWRARPDLINSLQLDAEQQRLLADHLAETGERQTIQSNPENSHGKHNRTA